MGRKVTTKVDRDEKEVVASWQQLSRLMTLAGEEEFTPNPSGPIGYHEMRAVRFAYCVLGWSALKIAKATGRGYPTLRQLIYVKRFNALRERIEREIVKKAVKGIASDVEEVTALTATALKHYLTDIVKTEAPLSAKDAKLISDIGANFHRILQLIKGKPTSISKVSEMTDAMAIETLASTLKKMKEDPMFDMQKFLSELNLSPEDAKTLSQEFEDDESEGPLFN